MAHVGLIHHVQGGSLLASEFDHVDAANVEMIALYFGGHGQHVPELHRRFVVGLLIQVGCG